MKTYLTLHRTYHAQCGYTVTLLVSLHSNGIFYHAHLSINYFLLCNVYTGEGDIISIFGGFKMSIEISVTKVIVQHYKACSVTPFACIPFDIRLF